MMAIYCAVAFGLLGLAALIVHRAETRALGWAEAEMIGTARALGQTIEGRFDAAEAALHGLAAMGSYSLGKGGPGGFAAPLAAFARAANLGMVSLVTPDGRLLLRSGAPPGTEPLDVLAPPAARQAFLTGRTEIGDLIRDPAGGEYQVAVAVPVERPDSGAEPCRCYALSLSLAATDLAAALRRQELPPGWVAAVIDRTGHVVARSERHEEFVGSGVIPAIKAAIESGSEPKVVRTRRIDGVESSIALVRSGKSGFRIAIAAPERLLASSLRDPLRWALLAGVSIALAGLLLVLLLARRIVRGIAWLGSLGEAPPAAAATVTGFSEIDRAARSLTRAVEAQRQQALGLSAGFQAASIGLAHAELESGRLLLVNARLCTLLGQPEAGLLRGMDIATLFGAEAIGDYRLDLRQHGSATRSLRHHRPDGSTISLQLGIAPITAAALTPPRIVLVVEDVTERHRSLERMALVMREMSHRAMNALALVQATLRLTPRADAAAYAAAVEARVAALARAHARLVGDCWSGGSLRALAEGELRVFQPNLGDQRRIGIDGPEMRLLPQAVQPLAMALHELATNSTKHGALSCPTGRVMLHWRTDRVRETLRLHWEEADGPLIAGPPSRRGFGSRLLDATIRGQLGGTVTLSWRRTGLSCRIEIPLARAALADAADGPIRGGA